jgi:signal transduction histidine kinase
MEAAATMIDHNEQEENLAVLGKAAAFLAHEVKNPLGSIKLFVSLLRQDLKQQEGSLELVDHIEKSVHNLDQIVTNILWFAKGSPGKASLVNLHSLLHERVHGFQAASPEVKFILALEGGPFLQGHETGLRQVVDNLLFNAIQAMRAKGTVSISTRDDGADFVRILVRDSGPGIPDENLSQLFNPFFTTRSEGTGLGLAIVKQIIAAHQGDIRVYNDTGAVFELGLPRKCA